MSEPFDTYVRNAIQWAEAHLGSSEYATLCLAFVEDAYEEGNHVEIFGGSTAQESAEEYGAAQNFEQSPPIGAFVFYESYGTLFETYKNWGHVGLYIGDGQVIHAWNVVRKDAFLDVQNLTPAPGWTAPKYIGWSPVERVFRGYRKKD